MANGTKNFVETNLTALQSAGIADTTKTSVEYVLQGKTLKRDVYLLKALPPLNEAGKQDNSKYHTGYKALTRADFATDKLWFEWQLLLLSRQADVIEMKIKACLPDGSYPINAGVEGKVASAVKSSALQVIATLYKQLFAMGMVSTPEQATAFVKPQLDANGLTVEELAEAVK